nr:MAG: internal scaffolding protein [Microvirus sp.]
MSHINTPFNRVRPPGIVNDMPSMTQQHFKDECDVNNIIAKFVRTGVLPANCRPGDYFDCSNITDYQDCLNRVLEAQANFEALPSELRKHFQNDPGVFLEFIQNPDNLQRGIEIGLYAKEDPLTQSLNNDNPSTPPNPQSNP